MTSPVFAAQTQASATARAASVTGQILDAGTTASVRASFHTSGN